MQADPKCRPVIVGAVALRAMQRRCARRTAAARKPVAERKAEGRVGCPVPPPEHGDTPDLSRGKTSRSELGFRMSSMNRAPVQVFDADGCSGPRPVI